MSDRVPLKGRDDLSIYWDNHLRVAFEQSAGHDLPAMVEASLAHVLMLERCGTLPADRAARLLVGLRKLWDDWGGGLDSPSFDGTSEDPYYYLEHRLAEACGIERADLDVQLARSRNDLDSGVFRMILRRMVLDELDLLAQLIGDTADKTEETVDAVIIGYTHRRPAQPTTIAHVLSGLSDAWLSQAQGLLGAYDELNVSPLGGAAFAGTDLAVDADMVADLLGFDSSYTSSYEAIAGAEHLMRLAAEQARIGATAARWSRVLLEWMDKGWVATPLAFTQGSSIMPQKVNPVVCEHLVSMGGAGVADLSATFTNITQAWYEDSNNATTDVQQHLWRSADRIVRTLRLLDGLMLELAVKDLPSTDEIVASGATTTAVAEALAAKGVPWRGAHSLVGRLVRTSSPLDWDEAMVAAALAESSLAATLAATVLTAGQHPEQVLVRTQPGSPGRAPIAHATAAVRDRVAFLRIDIDRRRHQLDTARETLLAAADAFVADRS